MLAILTNGTTFRIYSPQWRYQKAFSDKLIYRFELTDLIDTHLVNRLEKIIGYSNYISGEFLKNIEEREIEILEVNNRIEEFNKANSSETEELKKELNLLRIKMNKIDDEITVKEEELLRFETNKRPEIETLIKDYFIPKTIDIYTSGKPISTTNIDKHNIGERLIINKPKYGIHAYGNILENNKFIVHKDSTISTYTAPKFLTSAKKAYELRAKYTKNGTINSNRQFTTNIEFNSRSQAASVIMGDSKNGNKEWKKE